MGYTTTKTKKRFKSSDPTAHIFYKDGFSPLNISVTYAGNTGRVLISQGWRNMAMMNNPRKVRGTGGRKSVTAPVVSTPAPHERKEVRKNPKSKLFRMIEGVFIKK